VSREHGTENYSEGPHVHLVIVLFVGKDFGGMKATVPIFTLEK
jgi:hypothetical protein